MPAGIVQPGGAGTTIFVYDNAAAANGLYYTFAEIEAFCTALGPPFDQDFQFMVGQNSLNQWGGIRKQYLSQVTITIGGQNADGTNPTYIQDTNCDVFFQAGSLNYRTVGYSNALLKTTFGTRIGTAIGGDLYVSGIEGVDIYVRGVNQVFRGGIFLYGSKVFLDAGTGQQIQFVDSSSLFNGEIAGCLFRTSGFYVIGTSNPAALDVYDTRFGSTAGAPTNMITAVSIRNSRNVVFVAAAPNSFIRTASPNLELTNPIFIGDPVASDLVWGAGGGSGWDLFNPTFSNNGPRFSGNGPSIGDPTKEFWYYNVKVCDLAGQPITDIPVQLESDIDGVVVDTKTFGDGDIGFVHGPTGFGNAVLVRDHYDSGGGIYAVRDRVFTLKVNGFGGLFVRNPNYPSWGLRFEWPGLDVFNGAFSPSGGEFKRVVMPVTLGAVGTTPPMWAECEE